MTTSVQPPESPHSSALVLYLFRLWQRYRWPLIIIPTVSMLLMGLYAFLGMKVWYKATVTAFPPVTTEAGGLGGLLSGLPPGLPGLELTKLSAQEGQYSPLVILTSRRMLDTLIDLYQLADLYELPDSPRSKIRKYVAADIEVERQREGNYQISVSHTDPKMAAQIANHMVELANKFASELARKEYQWQIEFLSQRLASVEQALQQSREALIAFADRYQIVEPETQVKTAIRSIAELRAEITKYRIQLQFFKQAYGDNDPAVQAYQRIIDQLQNQLLQMESRPGYFGKFPIQKGAKISLQYLELLTNVETYYRIKAFLIPMLEETKVKAQRFNRILNVLDPAIPPDLKDRPKRSLYILGAGIGSFLLLLVFLIVRERYRFYRTMLDSTE